MLNSSTIMFLAGTGIWGACGIAAAIIANRRGAPWLLWFVVAVVLGPFSDWHSH